MTAPTMPGRDPHDLADHYVLGLLDENERRAVEQGLDSDPRLAAAVAAARDRFAELDMTAAQVSPSAELWARIEGRLGAAASDGPVVSGEGVPAGTQGVAPANDNRVSRWRGLALAGMAASLVLAAGLAWNLTRAQEPQVIAVLLDEAGQPLVLVEDYGNDTARVTPLTELEVPEGRTMQVWTLPNQEMGPVSLGLLGQSESTLLDGPDLPAPEVDQLYEITIEQEGGSPTGRPTGPILVKGFAKAPR